jgi:hypothetical protein
VTIASPSIRQERAGNAATAAAASEAPSEIVAVSSEEPHPGSFAPRHDAEAVMLDLVNPIPAGRRFIGTAGQVWLDEVVNRAGTRTRQHTVLDSAPGARIRVRPKAAPAAARGNGHADAALGSGHGRGDGQLVLIVGEPGLGKSRLIEEFHARIRETPHTWAEWSCSQLLQNMPLHPVTEWAVSVSVARRPTTAFRPRKAWPLKSLRRPRCTDNVAAKSRGPRRRWPSASANASPERLWKRDVVGKQAEKSPMRVVALEEHFTVPALVRRIDPDAISRRGFRPRKAPANGPNPLELLPDIGERRLKSMDDAGVTVQVLSNSGPGPDLVPIDGGKRYCRRRTKIVHRGRRNDGSSQPLNRKLSRAAAHDM